MKKETLYEIYDSTFDIGLITKKLFHLEKLSNKAGEIFKTFVKNGLVDENSIENIIKLCQDIESCEMYKDTEEELISIINETLMNDYVDSLDDINDILENYLTLLDDEIIDGFLFDKIDEAHYYKLYVIRYFNKILDSIDNNKHDIYDIMDAYKEMLEDLKNTRSISYMDYNEMLKTRIKYFTDLITNTDVCMLDDKKYSSVLYVANKTSSLDKLKLLKSTVIFNNSLDFDEFVDILDSKSQELNTVTIGRLLKYANIKKVKEKDGSVSYIRNIKDEEEERQIIKKVLKP